MSATTFSDDITFNEIQWRSHAVIADGAKAIVKAASRSKIANGVRLQTLYFQIYQNVRSMSTLTNEILDLFHAPEAIMAIEAAAPEDMQTIVETMNRVHAKIEQTLQQVKPPKYWGKLYKPVFDRLSANNVELRSHSLAFADKAHTALILLSRRDQLCLLESIQNPPEPNAALRRAFLCK
jgi:hypothetical protein